MIALVLKSLLVLLAALGVFLPLAAWAERRHAAFLRGGTGPDQVEVVGLQLAGLLHPLADGIKQLTKQLRVPAEAHRGLHLAAPLAAFLLPLAALAVIPFGSRYSLGSVHPRLVVADPDWGVLYLLALGSLAAWIPALAAWGSGDAQGLRDGLHDSARRISGQLALALSLLGLLLVQGTLSLAELAALQDRGIPLFGFLVHLGMLTELPPSLAFWQLPAWGIFLQPLGFLLFVGALVAAGSWAPPPAAAGGPGTSGPAPVPATGLRHGMFVAGARLELLAGAMLLTTLFLGGWSLPWLSQGRIVGAIEPLFGAGLANAVCLVLHLGSFLAKLAAVYGLQLALRAALPRLDPGRLMDLCWRALLPLAIANLFATAGLVLFLERG